MEDKFPIYPVVGFIIINLQQQHFLASFSRQLQYRFPHCDDSNQIESILNEVGLLKLENTCSYLLGPQKTRVFARTL